VARAPRPWPLPFVLDLSLARDQASDSAPYGISLRK
jgi:hypothetical protein